MLYLYLILSRAFKRCYQWWFAPPLENAVEGATTDQDTNQSADTDTTSSQLTASSSPEKQAYAHAVNATTGGTVQQARELPHQKHAALTACACICSDAVCNSALAHDESLAPGVGLLAGCMTSCQRCTKSPERAAINNNNNNKNSSNRNSVLTTTTTLDVEQLIARSDRALDYPRAFVGLDVALTARSDADSSSNEIVCSSSRASVYAATNKNIIAQPTQRNSVIDLQTSPAVSSSAKRLSPTNAVEEKASIVDTAPNAPEATCASFATAEVNFMTALANYRQALDASVTFKQPPKAIASASFKSSSAGGFYAENLLTDFGNTAVNSFPITKHIDNEPSLPPPSALQNFASSENTDFDTTCVEAKPAASLASEPANSYVDVATSINNRLTSIDHECATCILHDPLYEQEEKVARSLQSSTVESASVNVQFVRPPAIGGVRATVTLENECEYLEAHVIAENNNIIMANASMNSLLYSPPSSYATAPIDQRTPIGHSSHPPLASETNSRRHVPSPSPRAPIAHHHHNVSSPPPPAPPPPRLPFSPSNSAYTEVTTSVLSAESGWLSPDSGGSRDIMSDSDGRRRRTDCRQRRDSQMLSDEDSDEDEDTSDEDDSDDEDETETDDELPSEEHSGMDDYAPFSPMIGHKLKVYKKRLAVYCLLYCKPSI